MTGSNSGILGFAAFGTFHGLSASGSGVLSSIDKFSKVLEFRPTPERDFALPENDEEMVFRRPVSINKKHVELFGLVTSSLDASGRIGFVGVCVAKMPEREALEPELLECCRSLISEIKAKRYDGSLKSVVENNRPLRSLVNQNDLSNAIINGPEHGLRAMFAHISEGIDETLRESFALEALAFSGWANAPNGCSLEIFFRPQRGFKSLDHSWFRWCREKKQEEISSYTKEFKAFQSEISRLKNEISQRERDFEKANYEWEEKSKRIFSQVSELRRRLDAREEELARRRRAPVRAAEQVRVGRSMHRSGLNESSRYASRSPYSRTRPDPIVDIDSKSNDIWRYVKIAALSFSVLVVLVIVVGSVYWAFDVIRELFF